MNFIELQHDEFSEHVIQEFWNKVKTINNQGISLEFNRETATLLALKIDWMADWKIPAGVRLNAYKTMIKWDYLADDPGISDDEYEDMIKQETNLIMRHVKALKPVEIQIIENKQRLINASQDG
ncbi:hypothetical protein [Gynuella sp.]|uniref:hypothetical protein n=1 Tax=Gynuella sp. TaxID=2969146 RepID=UPI003D127723